MADIIQLRRDTAANWTSVNPTLAQGEIAVETDTGFMKLGDGSTAWTSLAYLYTGEVTLANTATMTNKTLSGVVLSDGYSEEVFTVASDTPALSPANGSIQNWVLGGNAVPTEGTFTDGSSLVLFTTAGSNTIDWGSMTNLVWSGGSAPTLPTTGQAVMTFIKRGTSLYGFSAGDVA